MHIWAKTAFAAGVFVLAPGAAQAACDVDKPGSEMTHQEAAKVYHCLEKELHAGYMQGDKRWIPGDFVTDYRGWKAASDFPAAPGFHGERYLVTFVNPVGEAEYMRFKDEGAMMPAGSVLAKESFTINDEGKVSRGPLFLMEKVAAGSSPATGDWYYMAVTPSGTPMTMDVVSACSDCHQSNFGKRDGLGYPVEEVRAKP
ncbi:cytochrome P460 family protein [Stappia stellulata]|uniref:cytochrome P460 family protein n=1 Tax=Stappia stellulata TaxID=71235 RepID=UPI0003F58CF0|nr:cytochrome P460 family protein [Stappia stellulata]